jgi:Flp pilus assembly protein TadB
MRKLLWIAMTATATALGGTALALWISAWWQRERLHRIEREIERLQILAARSDLPQSIGDQINGDLARMRRFRAHHAGLAAGHRRHQVARRYGRYTG